MGVGIGKFLIDLGVRCYKRFLQKITCSGTILLAGCLPVSLHYNNGLKVVMK